MPIPRYMPCWLCIPRRQFPCAHPQRLLALFMKWSGVEWSGVHWFRVEWQGVILAILARIRNRGVHVIQLWQRVFSHRFLCALHNLTARNCRGNYF